MKRMLALCAAAAAAWPALAQADIYKCTDGFTTIYQSKPCAPGQAQTVFSVASRAAPSVSVVPSTSPPAPRVAAIPPGRDVAFRRTTIALGVSDDEVLNMPGWGVPTRIERSRERRLYREEWRYATPSGDTRVLHFANSRLTGMDIERPMPQLAGFDTR